MKDFRIPTELYEKMSSIEYLVFSRLLYLASEDGTIEISLRDLEKRLKIVSKSSIQRCLTGKVLGQLLGQSLGQKRQSLIIYNIDSYKVFSNTIGTESGTVAGTKKESNKEKLLLTSSLSLDNKLSQDNNNINNNESKLKKRVCEEEIFPETLETPPKKERKRKEFTPPTIEEVTEYRKERNLHFRVEEFFQYYSNQNWVMSNGKPVKNWKNCCNTFEASFVQKHPLLVENIDLYRGATGEFKNFLKYLIQENSIIFERMKILTQEQYEDFKIKYNKTKSQMASALKEINANKNLLFRFYYLNDALIETFKKPQSTWLTTNLEKREN